MSGTTLARHPVATNNVRLMATTHIRTGRPAPGWAGLLLRFSAVVSAGMTSVVLTALYARDLETVPFLVFVQPTTLELRDFGRATLPPDERWREYSFGCINGECFFARGSEVIEPPRPMSTICGVFVSRSFIAGKVCEADSLRNFQHWFVITADAPTTVERFTFESVWRARAEQLLAADLGEAPAPSTPR